MFVYTTNVIFALCISRVLERGRVFVYTTNIIFAFVFLVLECGLKIWQLRQMIIDVVSHGKFVQYVDPASIITYVNPIYIYTNFCARVLYVILVLVN